MSITTIWTFVFIIFCLSLYFNPRYIYFYLSNIFLVMKHGVGNYSLAVWGERAACTIGWSRRGQEKLNSLPSASLRVSGRLFGEVVEWGHAWPLETQGCHSWGIQLAIVCPKADLRQRCGKRMAVHGGPPPALMNRSEQNTWGKWGSSAESLFWWGEHNFISAQLWPAQSRQAAEPRPRLPGPCPVIRLTGKCTILCDCVCIVDSYYLW